MGQRSQIFVRMTDNTGKKKLIARYYQWCYGDRMVSRARYALEWINERIDYVEYKEKELIRILDTNFDMKDVVISSDLIEEYNSDYDYSPSDMKSITVNDYIFDMQDNDDGKLLIDVLSDGTLKYAFLDRDNNLFESIERYMDWDEEDWMHPNEYRTQECIYTTQYNIYAIKSIATQMTEEEVEEFLAADYSHLIKINSNSES